MSCIRDIFFFFLILFSATQDDEIEIIRPTLLYYGLRRVDLRIGLQLST